MGCGGLESDALRWSVDIARLHVTYLATLVAPVIREPSSQSFLRFRSSVRAASTLVFLGQQAGTIRTVFRMLLIDLSLHFLAKLGIAQLTHFNLKRNSFCCLLRSCTKDLRDFLFHRTCLDNVPELS